MTKRANGEGSVYRRSDGRWTAAYYVFRPDGGRDRKFVYGKTRAEAAGQLARLVAKTAAGIPLATKTWTVSSYSAHWLEHVVAPRLRPTTVASYRDTLRLHILPTLGRQTPRRLTPAAIRQLRRDAIRRCGMDHCRASLRLVAPRLGPTGQHPHRAVSTHSGRCAAGVRAEDDRCPAASARVLP